MDTLPLSGRLPPALQPFALNLCLISFFPRLLYGLGESEQDHQGERIIETNVVPPHALGEGKANCLSVGPALADPLPVAAG
tara:strand:- start:485 stop:727 length:243 start_codon:yes stop_codon:yes gene_type:complete